MAGLAIAGTLQARQNSSEFDYYVLSLSWSPSYCAVNGDRDPVQCRSGRRYAFIVHGLWPQFDRGWPSYCDPDPAFIPNRMIASLRDIMPSKRLVIHQWKKHGTCSGLSAQGYFEMTRGLFEKIRIPARYLSPNDVIQTTPRQLTQDFLKTNRQLTADMLSVQCGNSRDRARLSELRICFSKDGKFIPCGVNERRSCRARILTLPPVR